jgi:hypothetical protein
MLLDMMEQYMFGSVTLSIARYLCKYLVRCQEVIEMNMVNLESNLHLILSSVQANPQLDRLANLTDTAEL